MIDLKKRWTYGAEIDALRRGLNRQNSPNDPSSFKFENIDWSILYNFYPNDIPPPMKHMFDKHGIDINIENKPLYYSSSVIICTLELENKNRNSSNSIKWHEDISKIKNKYRNDFNEIISSNRISHNGLKKHGDTLFLVCLYFYNKLWDAYGLTFAGANSRNHADKLNYYDQPFEYRAIKQVKFVSQIIYDYYKHGNSQKSIGITSGNKTHEIADPIMSEWIIESLLNCDLPASTSYEGTILRKLIANRHNTALNEWLIELKKFTKLKEPDYNGIKRNVIKKFCIEINKVFSHYLGLPTNGFNGGRLYIYVKILKMFHMANFEVPQRMYGTKSDKPRIGSAENRLGALLRDKRIT